MPTEVLWREPLDDAQSDRLLKELRHKAKVHIVPDDIGLERYLERIEVLVDGFPKAGALSGPRLKHVLIPWAGVGKELREELQKRPHITLHNSHYNAPLVAQHAVALVLACACRIVESDALLRQGDWTTRHEPAYRSLYLTGRRALLVGLGAIGREVGARLKAMGMALSGVKRDSSRGGAAAELGIDRLYHPRELVGALAEADVVVVSVPSTPETRRLLGPEEFAAMRNSAILVNVGRGDVVDEEAAFNALDEGRILAAGFDVWWRYPQERAAARATLPSKLPFHRLPNVILSPHRANEMQEDLSLRFQDLLTTLRAVLRGEMRNKVDLERGY